MSGQQELLKLLEVISQRVQHHHDALWEEEKHYSWWIYIIFAGLIYLYLNHHVLLMVLGSAFGLVISIMGYYVVRREGEFYYETRHKRNRVLACLELEQSIIQDFDPVRSEANRPLLELFSKAFRTLLHTRFRRKSTKRDSNDNFGIRDAFQLTFIMTAILFFAFGIFSVVLLLRDP
jgi:hypothetical protein